MENIRKALRGVLEQVENDVLVELESPGATHLKAVIELDQSTNDKIGIKYYVVEKRFLLAKSEGAFPE